MTDKGIIQRITIPDGNIMVVDWYNKTLGTEYEGTGTPYLYHKYVGHDNNRDAVHNTQVESQMVSKFMYKEWYPQIMYNHHQTGPSDIIVFVPPFRDPPNYWYDPILITGVQSVGLAMHSRLISEGMPGSGMRSTNRDRDTGPAPAGNSSSSSCRIPAISSPASGSYRRE